MISARHKEITHDLNNYADVIHHSPAIDLQVLFHPTTGDYRVSRETPTAPLERLKAQVAVCRINNVWR